MQSSLRQPPRVRAAACLRGWGLLLACLVGPAGLTLAAEPPAAFTVEAPAAPADSAAADATSRTHFTRAALEVLGVNVAVWSYDRFIREGGENPEFRIGSNSIWENMKNRFEWDNNSFGTNNFSHPYHGSLYYTAARANGYSYWESIPFVFAGSYLWEFTGEANNPAYNDWLNTSIGGVVIGESLYRLSDLVLDDTATGTGRFFREFGGLVISPMRGINRLISGEWSRVGPNPPDRLPNRLGFRLETGMRSQGQESLANEDTSGVYVSFDLLYGNPFTDDSIRPFDEFTFSLQLNFNDVSSVGRMQIDGLLFGETVHRSESAHHILGADQYFEFVNNRGYEFGGQSVGAAWLARYGKPEAPFALVTDLGLGLMPLGGTSSEVANFSGRDYDYGSGFTYHASALLFRRHRTLVELRSEGNWLYTLNGVDGRYFINIAYLQATLPLYGNLGIGGELRGYYRKAWYDQFDDVSRWLPEARVFVMFTND
jgi:hypothetical protein